MLQFLKQKQKTNLQKFWGFFGEDLSLFFLSKLTLSHKGRNGIFIVRIFGLDTSSIVFLTFMIIYEQFCKMQLKSLNNRQHGLTNSSLTFRVKTAQTTEVLR